MNKKRYLLLIDGNTHEDHSGPHASIAHSKLEADDYAGASGNDAEYEIVELGAIKSIASSQRNLHWKDRK